MSFSSNAGISDVLAWKILITHLSRNKSYLFLIIDEVHNLQRDEILRILNIGETFGHHNVRISFLLISRLNAWLKIEDEKILSRLDAKIELRPYNYEEVIDILQEKSDEAFKEGIIGQELLCKIAKIVMKNKDLRIGIQILRMLGEKANNLGLKEITSGLLTPELENFNSKFLNDIQMINSHELLCLYSVLKAIKLSNIDYTTISESYSTYRYLCLKYSLIPHVKITYTKHVRHLKNNHLLNTQRITIENRRWILKIVPKFDVSEGLSVLKILINKCKA